MLWKNPRGTIKVQGGRGENGVNIKEGEGCEKTKKGMRSVVMAK